LQRQVVELESTGRLAAFRPGRSVGQGRSSFVGSVLDVVDDFYALVVQYLEPWAPTPPRMKPTVDENKPKLSRLTPVSPVPCA
jgi:hypothetical protein